MSSGYLLVAAAYVAFAAGLCLFESRRTRHSGIDAISIFIVLVLLQCCLAGAAIYGLLPYADPNAPTEVPAFDRILGQTDLTTALLVWCMTVWFTIFFYLGNALTRALFLPPRATLAVQADRLLIVRKGGLFVVLALGMALTLYSFYLLGDDMLTRYAQLVLFRGFEGDVERNALNANALALTQTWNWLSAIAVFCLLAERRWRWLLPVAIGALLVFALLGVSRRALFVPVLMLYLMSVVYSGSWKMRRVLAAAVPLVVLVSFGKNIFAAIGAGDIETTAGYDSWAGAMLRAAADIGITIIESLGTLQLLDLHLRLGVDHLISMVKIFPEETLGFTIDYPERIVRISTEAFDGADGQDIPPGLIGQMWLDFGVLGPLLWGLGFGVQMALVQSFFERVRRTRQAVAVLVVVVFVVALPLNTGSFDFTFSVDIIALAVALLLCVRLRVQPLAQGRLVSLPATPLSSSQIENLR